MKKKLIIVSIVCYVISLALPVFLRMPIEKSGYAKIEGFGYEFLYLGWIMALEHSFDFVAWLVNITLIISWIFNKKKFAKYLAYFSVFIIFLYALDYFLQLKIFDIMYYNNILFGYFLWLASGVLTSIYFYQEQKRTKLL